MEVEMKILVTEIDWDCEDDAERAKLPTVVVLDVGDHLLTHIAGELSEQTGWCVHDFRAVLLDVEDFARTLRWRM